MAVPPGLTMLSVPLAARSKCEFGVNVPAFQTTRVDVRNTRLPSVCMFSEYRPDGEVMDAPGAKVCPGVSVSVAALAEPEPKTIIVVAKATSRAHSADRIWVRRFKP
jgi:hypothetical protein